MFDVGFSEMLLCFLVALVVLGPEKLPKLARTVGRWTGQAKGYLRNLSAELDREAELSELRRKLDETRRAMQEGAEAFRDTVRKEADTLREQADRKAEAARETLRKAAGDAADKP